MREKAQRNPLTKLSNKITTRKLVEQYNEDDYDSTNAILMIDITDLKHVNDNFFGHLVGSVARRNPCQYITVEIIPTTNGML